MMQKHHRECPATDDFTAGDIVHAPGLAQASLENDRRYQDDVYSIVAALRDIEAISRWEFANVVS
ncbi:hypothetical protein [Rhizobium sp. AN80A]|uniref:hypothetical protein n=1 Tax=Rhizobium sp. AN80A TaxID=3040673 RepID=UPI0024B389BD|nr:hypothetical protein [Rhizobium sp. AN80A]